MPYLQEVAQLDSMSSKKYVQNIVGSYWGGRPEAKVITSYLPVEIFAWTDSGRLLYHEATMASMYDNGIPLYTVHLGWYNSHYVLLSDQPGQHREKRRAARSESLRGGVIRGAKPKSAPRRDDPRSPLPRRRRSVALREAQDTSPPLLRGGTKRPRNFQLIGNKLHVLPKQLAKFRAVKKRRQLKEQPEVTPYMSDAEYERLAVKRRKTLDAIALRHHKEQEQSQEAQEKIEQHSSARASSAHQGQHSQAVSGPSLPATCGAPFSASTSSLYQKVGMGHSWVETKFWSDASGSGQDLYCRLCSRWYSRQHEQGALHLQRCESYGLRPDTDDEAEQATRLRCRLPWSQSPAETGR